MVVSCDILWVKVEVRYMLDLLKTAIEICGLERTIITFGTVAIFFILAAITLTLIAKKVLTTIR